MPEDRKGLAEKLLFKCNLCSNITTFETSRKVFIDKQKKHRQAYAINVRAVIASTTTGRKGLQKICGILDLPKPITSKPHNELM